ncbi:MAG: hypothetical protein AAGB05_17095 [Pseudomonadota bacterium]
MKEFTFLVFGFALLAATGAEAQNARNCGQRDMIIERLAEGYGESRQSVGLGANNSVMEVFASSETGTWTITVTSPNGLMCLVASGRAYEALEEELEPAGLPL